MSELPLMEMSFVPVWKIITIIFLPVLSAVMSPRNSQPQNNPYVITEDNCAHRHHCRVSATLPGKKKEVSVGFMFLLCSVTWTGCAVVRGSYCPSMLPLFLSRSQEPSLRRGVSQVAYCKVKPWCAHSLPMRQEAHSLPPFYLPP